MYLPKATIDRISEQADIVTIISEFADLQEKGNEYQSLCPFLDHTDSDPSFKVNPQKGLFYCFGCKRGGNVFTFIQQYNQMGFLEAVKFVGQRVGVSVDDIPDEHSSARSACEFAAISGYKYLKSNDLPYFESRLLDKSIIDKYNLGYCSGNWHSELKDSGYSDLALEHSGILSQGMIIKDTFRGRYIFPFRDPNGSVIGFSATAPNVEPKYLNTRDTPIFKKSRYLYGLYEAKDEIKKLDAVILVEGFFDCLNMVAAGFKNTIALCGTGFTRSHAKLLKKYTSKVILLFDGDMAGRKATKAAFPYLFEQGIEVTIANCIDNDPDFILNEHGRDGMLKILKSSFPFLQTFIKTTDTKLKLKLIQLAKQLATNMSNHSLFLDLVSTQMEIDKDILYTQDKVIKKKGVPLPNLMQHNFNEMVLLAGLLSQPKREDIIPELFSGEVLPYYEQIVNAQTESELYNNIDAEGSNVMSRLVFMSKDGIPVDAVIRAVRKEQINRKIGEVTEKLNLGDSWWTKEETNNLTSSLDKLIKMRGELK